MRLDIQQLKRQQKNTDIWEITKIFQLGRTPKKAQTKKMMNMKSRK